MELVLFQYGFLYSCHGEVYSCHIYSPLLGRGRWEGGRGRKEGGRGGGKEEGRVGMRKGGRGGRKELWDDLGSCSEYCPLLCYMYVHGTYKNACQVFSWCIN